MAEIKPGRTRKWWLIGGFVALIVLATVPTVWERVVAHPYLRDLTGVPAEPTAIVFGAQVDGDRPSAFLASRLDAAVLLYTHHRVGDVLVSGNDDGHGYDEPDVMRSYLVAHGVPQHQITVDRAGFDTWDTCERARRVFHVDHAILVTQTFHVARAVTLCRANGVVGYGTGVDSMSVGVTSTVYGYVREYFAADKAMWDVLIA